MMGFHKWKAVISIPDLTTRPLKMHACVKGFQYLISTPVFVHRGVTHVRVEAVRDAY